MHAHNLPAMYGMHGKIELKAREVMHRMRLLCACMTPNACCTLHCCLKSNAACRSKQCVCSAHACAYKDQEGLQPGAMLQFTQAHGAAVGCCALNRCLLRACWWRASVGELKLFGKAPIIPPQRCRLPPKFTPSCPGPPRSPPALKLGLPP